MEIKFDNVIYDKKTLNMTLNSNDIVAIIDDYDCVNLSNLLIGKIKFTGKISIDGKNYQKINSKIKKLMSISSGSEDYGLFNINILEDIKYNNNKFNEVLLQDYMKKFNVDSEILSKCYNEISEGEKKKVSILCTLLSQKNILIFENPTSYLDNKTKEVFIKELRRIKREGKIIIIITNDTDLVLKVSDKIALIDDKKSCLYSNKYSCFLDKAVQNHFKIKTPEIIEFINAVYKYKKIKLNYRDDINETIKDVYRNVSKHSM